MFYWFSYFAGKLRVERKVLDLRNNINFRGASEHAHEKKMRTVLNED